MAQDKIKALYDTFVKEGYEMESEAEFRKNLTNPAKRKSAYDALVNDGYDMEAFDAFENNLGFGPMSTKWLTGARGAVSSMLFDEDVKPIAAPAAEAGAASERAWEPTAQEKLVLSSLRSEHGEEARQAAPDTQAVAAGPWQSDEQRALTGQYMSDMMADYNAQSRQRVEQIGRMTASVTPAGRQKQKAAEMQARLAGAPVKLRGLVSDQATEGEPSAQGQKDDQTRSRRGPVVYDTVLQDGKQVTRWLMPDGSLTTNLGEAEREAYGARRARLMDEFVGRMRDNGLDPAKEEDVEAQQRKDKLGVLESRVDDRLTRNEKNIREIQDARSERFDESAKWDDNEGFWDNIARILGGSVRRSVENQHPVNRPAHTLTEEDKDLRVLTAENQVLAEARKLLDTRKLKKSDGFMGGFWNLRNNLRNMGMGAKHTLGDADFYAGGIMSLQKATELMAIEDKLKSGGKLSDREAEFVYSTMLGQDVAANADVPNGYTAAQVTVEMFPFMVQMATNPASGLSRALVRKYGKNGLKKVALTVAGDVAESAVLANTMQAPKVAADAMGRYQGDAVQDENGNISFDGSHNWASAIAKAEGAAVIENYTEMLGSHFGVITDKAGQLLGSGVRKLGGGKVVDGVSKLVTQVRSTDWAKAIGNIESRTRWSGSVGEVLEEEAGIVLNSMFVGDNKFSDLWDADVQTDIVLGVGLFGGFVSGVKSAGYPFARAKAKSNLRKREQVAAYRFGEDWAPMREAIDQAEEPALNETVRTLIRERANSPEQARAIMEYAHSLMNARGFELAAASARAEGAITPEQQEAEESYNDGAEVFQQYAETTTEASSPGEAEAPVENAQEAAGAAMTEMQAISARFKAASEYCEEVFPEDTEMYMAQVRENPWGVLQDRTLTDDQREAVVYFINSKAALEGVLDASNEAAEQKREQVRMEVAHRVHQQRGMIVPATLKVDDKPVYIVSGEVAMFPDGSGVDVERTKALNPTGVIYVLDESGEYRPVSADQIFSVSEAIDPESELNQAYEEINRGQEALVSAMAERTGEDTRADSSLRSEDSEAQAPAPVPAEELEAEAPPAEPEEVDSSLRSEHSEEPAAHVAAEGSALSRVPMNERGEPDLTHESVDAGTAWNATKEFFDDAEDALSYVQAEIKKAEDDVTAAEKAVSKVKPTGGMIKYRDDKAAARARVDAAKARYARWKAIEEAQARQKVDEEARIAAERAAQAENEHDDAVARFEEEQRVKAEQAAEQAAVGTHNVHPKIRERWEAAPKVEGEADVITLPDGSTISGRYVLTEAGAASASHDVNNAFAPTEGFPIDENGQSVNDRDYQRDGDAQQIVKTMADAYDSRALQSPVLVSKDGIVLSGNNRTMSGDMAAGQGTDAAYNEYLSKFGRKFGVTPEDVAKFQHPRVVFVPDEDMPYDAATFARFNAQEMKSQSKPEAAVKFGKVVSDDVFGSIVTDLSRYDRMSDFYADQEAAARTLGALVEAGVIKDKQLPELRTGDALSASGKELIENTLIGKAFQAEPDAVRMIISMPSMRQGVIMGLNEIAHNRTLAEKGYDLSAELSRAVKLVFDAKRSAPDIYKDGMPVSPFGRQQGLFDDEFGESRVSDSTTLLLADILNSGKPGDMRKILATYNKEAAEGANGQMDLFTGDVANKEDILKSVIELFRNADPREQQRMVNEAIEKRKRDSEQNADGGSAAIEQTEAAGQRGEGGQERAGGNTGDAGRNGERTDNLQPLTSDYRLSEEVDENGRQFVLTSDGDLEFGIISRETGLTEAPILLSEGIITNPSTGDGYGLVHIEARHGNQIRGLGYDSVVSFIEDVARNYEVIKQGLMRDGNQTYMLQLRDKHNNTLMVELSGDGTYWNINTAGVFKTSYGKNRKEVYNRHTTVKQPAEVVEESQKSEQSGTTDNSRMTSPTSSFKKKYSRNKKEVYAIPAVGGRTNTDTPEVDSGQNEGVTAPAGNSPQTSAGKGSENPADVQEDSSLRSEHGGGQENPASGNSVELWLNTAKNLGHSLNETLEWINNKYGKNYSSINSLIRWAEKKNNGITQIDKIAERHLSPEDAARFKRELREYITAKDNAMIASWGNADQAGARSNFDRTVPTTPEAQRSAIFKIVDMAKRVKNRVERVVIGGITKRQAKDFAEHGIKVDDTWVHSFETSAVTHNQKHHGNEKVEASRGQIAITAEDYARIPEILESYDKISKSPNKTKGAENEVIIYEKDFQDGYVYYLEEKRDSRKSLSFHTMYKKKKGIDSSDGFAVNPTAPITPTATSDNFDSTSEGKGSENPADVQEGFSLRSEHNEPTEAQKKAGNYKMEHRRVDGHNISIENKKGSVRRGTGADGKQWESTMQNDYGYIRGTEGVDGDHIDVFLSDTPEQGDVFVVDQVNEDGSFDEHKVMYGFPSVEAAREAYLSNYEQGWTGLGAITQVSKDEFKKWVQSSRRKTKPFAEYKGVRTFSAPGDNLRVYDAAKGLLETAGVEVTEVSDAEAQAAADLAGAAYDIRTYHGTGADFDSFDFSHMGEGEGQQAFGWGGYVTEVKGIGKAYANAIGGRNSNIPARIMKAKDNIRQVRSWLRSYGNYDKFLKGANRHMRDLEKELRSAKKVGNESDVAFYEDLIKQQKESMKEESHQAVVADKEGQIRDYQDEITALEAQLKSSRHLYTVKIPDNTGHNYLAWDGRLTDEQERMIGMQSMTEGVMLDFYGDKVNAYDYFQRMGAEAKGFQIYRGLKRALGSDRAASEFLSRAGLTGISYAAEHNSGGRADGARNYVVFRPTDMKITGHARFLQDGDGRVLGWAKDGKVFLNRDAMNPETPLHEYTHLWDEMVRKENPELWERGKALMKELPLWDEVLNDPAYAAIRGDENELASEVHSRLTGRDGARILEDVIDDAQKHGAAETARAVTLVDRVKRWLGDMFNALKATLGKWSKKDLDGLTADDFARMTLRDLAEGVNPASRGDSSLRSEHDGGQETQKMIGKSLTEPEAADLVSRMEANAEEAPYIELTPENWLEQFGVDGKVMTPVGEVKMGEHQLQKLYSLKRTEYFGMIHPTLESPDIILEESDPKDGSERDSKYLFIKTFVKSDGSRIVHFESVTVKKDGMEVSISSHEIKDKSLKKKMQNDVVLHLDKKLSPSSEMRLTETPRESEGPDLVPTSDNVSSAGKDSENPADVQVDSSLRSEHGTEGSATGEGNRYREGEISDVDVYEKTASEGTDTTIIDRPNHTESGKQSADGIVDAKLQQFLERAGLEANKIDMRERVDELADKLNTPVRMISDEAELSEPGEDGKPRYSRRERRAKGWWNSATDEVVVVLPNNVNVADVESTVVHEVVGHKGLRAFIGAERFGEFLSEVYNHASDSIRKRIDALTDKMVSAEADRRREKKRQARERAGEDYNATYYADMAEARVEAEQKREEFRREATEEYMADLAGRIGDEGFNRMSMDELTLWGKIKARVQAFLDKFLRGLNIPKSIRLTDKDLSYILFKSWKNAKGSSLRSEHGGGVFAEAEDAVMRHKTGWDAELDAKLKAEDELERVNSRFNSELSRWQNGETNESEVLPVGKPMGVMKMFMPDLPIVIRQKVLTKARKKHQLDASELKNIPDGLAKPIFVFKSTPNTVSVLTQLKTGTGNNIFVAVELNKDLRLGGRRVEVNDILTVHGREVKNIVMPILENNSLVWVDKQKGLEWLHSVKSNSQANTIQDLNNPKIDQQRMNLADVEKIGLDLDDVAKVVNSFENPKYDEDAIIRFRDPEPGLEEFITRMKAEAAAKTGASVAQKHEALKAIADNLTKIHHKMVTRERWASRLRDDDKRAERLEEAGKIFEEKAGAQVEKGARVQMKYDAATAKSIKDLAMTLMNEGKLDLQGRSEINGVIRAITESVGKEDISEPVERLMDIMVENQLRRASDMYGTLFKVRGSKVNERGVEVQDELDPRGQMMLDAVRRLNKEKFVVTEDEDPFEAKMQEAEKLLDPEENHSALRRENAAIELAALHIARQYAKDIEGSLREEKELKRQLKEDEEDFKEGRISREELRTIQESTREWIRGSKLARIRAYHSLIEQLGGVMNESAERAQAWRQAEKERVEQIHHYANSDLHHIPYRESEMDETWRSKLSNNPVARIFLAPIATMEQVCRVIGEQSMDGNGYVKELVVDRWQEARDLEWRNTQKAERLLDREAQKVAGVKRWSDLYALTKKEAGTLKWRDGDDVIEHDVTQGNLMYIYQVGKMSDGRRLLALMGITDGEMAAVVSALDPKLREIADWLQEEYYPERRERYNAVHERMFGAPMAAIDNYVPLNVLQSTVQNKQELNGDNWKELPKTITKAVIRRVPHKHPIDIMGTDAVSLALDHTRDMETWAAMAEYRRDLTTLLRYNRFRSRLAHMTTIYGSGKEFNTRFDNLALLVAGAYHPKSSEFDKLARRITRFATGACIALRFNTAAKQLLSYPAFGGEAASKRLLQNMGRPGECLKFCLKNMPAMDRRWRERLAGNELLDDRGDDWKWEKKEFVKKLQRIGISPNAAVDLLTCCMGAEAVYHTQLEELTTAGFPKEVARKKALLEAEQVFNLSQQSSEVMYLSLMQNDRSYLTAAVSLFRTSPMSYTRQGIQATRELWNMRTEDARNKMIAFETTKALRDGILEGRSEAERRAAAEDYARKKLNRNKARNWVKAINFYFVLPALWTMGGALGWYALTGSDWDKKLDILGESAIRGCFGILEGVSCGGMLADVLYSLVMHKHLPGLDDTGLPFVNSLNDLIDTLVNDGDYVKAFNDAASFAIAGGLGINPQTLEDVIAAGIDHFGKDDMTLRDWCMFAMRAISVPQSQVDMVFFDDVELSAREAQGMTIDELAERYADFKLMHNEFATVFFYSDEFKAKRGERYREKVRKHAKGLLKQRNETEELRALLSEHEAEKERWSAVAALKEEDPDAYELAKVQLEYETDGAKYKRVNEYTRQMNKLTKQFLSTRDRDEAAELLKAMDRSRESLLEDISSGRYQERRRRRRQ